MEKAGDRWSVLNVLADQLAVIGAVFVLFQAVSTSLAIGLTVPGPAAACGVGLWLMGFGIWVRQT